MYTADIYRFDSSCQTLNGMLKISEYYATEHDIRFNSDKTRCMHFNNNDIQAASVMFMNNMLAFIDRCALLEIKVLPNYFADSDYSVQQLNIKCMNIRFYVLSM